ncbi:SDR family NAD(P)-dependent oxidoreductase [Microbacterium hominis]|uniref:SDR family oxidoreductase n=1 Tax=Microbacterium hominis TaxID=162426 RepID=A0A7D4UHH6_9MICO|nr:SDR family oxidoreductase [Microbacterium hominis]QKJ18528.1 SDR family oxidoreductase [Microbacterium hominis]
MKDHDGRTCLVIGGSSGIGRGACQALAAAGARVAVHGLDLDDAAQVAASIEESGGRAIAVAGDVRDPETSLQAVDTTLATFGSLDSLVVSSGIQRYGDVVETAVEEWDEVFDVNVRGAYLAARAALPAIRSTDSGTVVFVASVQGSASQPRVAAYSASKGALIALVRSMAVDEALHGVRVNSVSPGSIDTPMLRSSAEQASRAGGRHVEEVLAHWGTAHALGRVGDDAEVGEAIAFLAGPRSGFITGVDLRVDGGMMARLPAPIGELR